MKAKPSKFRVYWIASLGVVVVLCTYFGQAYYTLRSASHHLPVVYFSIAPDLDWLSTRMVEFELRRRIESGDSLGADVLFDTLALGLSREELRTTAVRRAEWLLSDLVDVNAEGTTGRTALHRAVSINDPIMAEELIRLGADPGIKSDIVGTDGSSLDALDYAKLMRAVFPDEDMSALFQVLETASAD